MFSKVHRSTRLFFAIIGASIIAIIVTFTPTSAAQNSVPPTAVQAAKMPQFASRLAHPAKRLLPPRSQPTQRGKTRRGPLDSTTLYENGPIDGNTDAWTINFAFITSDTFNIAANGTNITGMTFAAWIFPGDTLTSVEISITSEENGGTSYFDQTVNFTMGSCTGNQYGYNVCSETASFTGLTLNAGTYWVNLQNASVPSSDPVYWDENSGVGCQSTGCPSEASENSVGSIPSEAFSMLGTSTTTTTTTTSVTDLSCPEPQSGFHDLHDFDPGAATSGVATNAAGKVFGALASAGRYGAGLLYDLRQGAGPWSPFTSLYSFLGGSNGSSPSSFIVGPGGALYGTASGGIQNCGNGSSYCGLIYEARPGPAACATALCGWDETTIYQFTSDTDAAGGSVTAFDSAGNLYGISTGGGAHGQGSVFELTPSPSGWTETILYSFTGQSDGGGPNSLVLGQDGNLYGAAGGGLYRSGVAFQLVPSGSGWTENVIYTFTGGVDGWGPAGLIQGGPDYFYGTGWCNTDGYGSCYDELYFEYGMIFVLGRSDQGWAVTPIHVYRNYECVWSNFGYYEALAIGPGGNLYATESAGLYFWCSAVFDVSAQNLVVSGPRAMFSNMTSDATGKLYGTSPTCGFGTRQRTDSMVWQLSP